MRKHAIYFDPESKLTRQSFEPECNVNNIIRRYVETGGVITHVARTPPQYFDAPEGDFAELAGVQAGIMSAIEDGWEPPSPAEAQEEKPPEEAPEGLSAPEGEATEAGG